MKKLTVLVNDLKRHQSGINDIVLETFKRVSNSGFYILGKELELFEKDFATYCDVSHSIGVANGTDALRLALLAVGCQPGDEVVTVANAGMYTAVAALSFGAVPVFVDIDPNTMNMSSLSLAENLTPKTKAIVVTHLYGKMADMQKILEIAALRKIPVIEDCAQAVGASLQGRKAGSWGVMGCFSFYPTKNLGAMGDAGAITTNDLDLYNKIRRLRQYGWEKKYYAVEPNGLNSRLDELQAAILRAKLPFVDGWNEKRRSIVEKYKAVTAGAKDLLFTASNEKDYVAHLCVVRSKRREDLRSYLNEVGIMTDIHYPIPDYLQPALQTLPKPRKELKETESNVTEILTLPCFPEMSEEEVQYVCEHLAKFLEKNK